MTEAERLTRYFRVKGRVQGVGYRAFTKRSARALGITGWVRNCLDGTVEGEAAGSLDDLNQFFDLLASGPTHGNVIDLQVTQAQDNGISDFEIRR